MRGDNKECKICGKPIGECTCCDCGGECGDDCTCKNK